MNKRIVIESLAMDLKRVALGYHRGSYTVANRFKEEALKREEELENQDIDGYLKRLIASSRKVLNRDDEKVAEDALMYSILFQNFALKRLK